MGVWINDIAPETAAHTTAGGRMRLLVTGGAGYIGSVVAATLSKRATRSRSWTTCPPGTRTRCRPRPPSSAARCATTRPGCWPRAPTRCCTSRPSRWSASRWPSPACTGRTTWAAAWPCWRRCGETGVRRIVFSSTAASYGEPERTPIEETDPTRPTNPYGATKLAVDTTLTEYARMFGFGRGEPAVLQRGRGARGHRRPVVRRAARPRDPPDPASCSRSPCPAERRRPGVKIFGDDYPTPDGTCVRDYIHVADLAQAHLLALGATRRRASTGSTTWATAPASRSEQVVDVVPRGHRASTSRPSCAPRRDGRPGRAGRLLRADPDRPGLAGHAATCPRWSADAWTFGQQRARDAAQPGAGAR